MWAKSDQICVRLPVLASVHKAVKKDSGLHQVQRVRGKATWSSLGVGR